MALSHPYASLRLPSDAPFALRPSPGGKGWGGFATRDIKRGDVILREAPLFAIRKSLVDTTKADLLAVLQNLAPEEKQLFSCLRKNGSEPFPDIKDAIDENSFDLTPDGTAYGLFVLLSRFNHSCLPNARLPLMVSDTMAMIATKDIATGNEITICYGNDFEYMCRIDRHEELNFMCECSACLIGTPFQQLSDIRRIFLRALLYLETGRDLDGQTTIHTPHFVIEPELKEAAEIFEICLSKRLVHRLLIIFLMEEEGLLSDDNIQNFYLSVELIADLFETENNVETVELALEQNTWLGKLSVAFGMYGRLDAKDAKLSRRQSR